MYMSASTETSPARVQIADLSQIRSNVLGRAAYQRLHVADVPTTIPLTQLSQGPTLSA
ncbi:hypothetical protein DENSPDRAFT_845028 [Dentipellis sp. KUC8613]|nr:hypothetical protein DENSPDRAFT_845028 [Dentipellis sp. KUC8613]